MFSYIRIVTVSLFVFISPQCKRTGVQGSSDQYLQPTRPRDYSHGWRVWQWCWRTYGCRKFRYMKARMCSSRPWSENSCEDTHSNWVEGNVELVNFQEYSSSVSLVDDPLFRKTLVTTSFLWWSERETSSCPVCTSPVHGIHGFIKNICSHGINVEEIGIHRNEMGVTE